MVLLRLTFLSGIMIIIIIINIIVVIHLNSKQLKTGIPCNRWFYWTKIFPTNWCITLLFSVITLYAHYLCDRSQKESSLALWVADNYKKEGLQSPFLKPNLYTPLNRCSNPNFRRQWRVMEPQMGPNLLASPDLRQPFGNLLRHRL